MSDTKTLDEELHNLLNNSQGNKQLQHYVTISKPFSPALCGKKAPRGGWWNNPVKEAEATIDSWEVCPACLIRYNHLPTGRR